MVFFHQMHMHTAACRGGGAEATPTTCSVHTSEPVVGRKCCRCDDAMV